MERFEVEDGKVQYTDFIKFAQGNKSDLGGDDDSLVLVKAGEAYSTPSPW